MDTNWVVHWIEIYPVDRVIYLLNNWGLQITLCHPDKFLIWELFSGAPNENIVENHLNIALLNVF